MPSFKDLAAPILGTANRIKAQLDRIQGGANSLGDIRQAQLDELDLYTESLKTYTFSDLIQNDLIEITNDRPFEFGGIGFDFTSSGAWATGETIVITVEEEIDGTNYREIDVEVLMADPGRPLFMPRNAVTDLVPARKYIATAIKVTVQQSVLGGGYHTIAFYAIAAKS